MPEARYSDPVNNRSAFVEAALAKHAESFDIARNLSEMGERFIAGLQVDANNPGQVIPTCLLIRQISGLRSLCLLVANGFYTEAVAHQRGLMEALARLSV